MGEARRYVFFPIDAEWQKRIASSLGSMKPVACLYGLISEGMEMLHRQPIDTEPNAAGGACLPRTISQAIYGHEDCHEQLRNAVVDFILRTRLPSETERRNRAFYKRMAEMRKTSKWMTSFEIEAFSYLLETPIYSCVKAVRADGNVTFSWQRTPHPSSKKQVKNSRGIYIVNADYHFELVIEP